MAETTAKQKAYQELVKQHTPGRPMFKNTVRAFLVGGCICLLGQAIQTAFVQWGGFSVKDAGNPTTAILIILAILFTALGIYDKFAGWAGAGAAVPVTGFANTMASAAMESRAEGLVLGVGGNMFKIAGPVVVYGVVSAFFVAIIRYLIVHL